MPHTAPGPRRLRAAPPGLRGRTGGGRPLPRRRGGHGGGRQLRPSEPRQPPARDAPSGQPRTPGGASAPPAPSLPPPPPPPARHRRLHRLPLPLVPPPDLVSGGRCAVPGRHRGGGTHTHDTPFAAPPPPPPRRDGPRRSPPAPRPRRGRAAAAAKPSQVTKSNLKPGTINEDFCRPWRLVLPGTKINARNRNLIT